MGRRIYGGLSNEEIYEVFEALRLATEAERQRMRFALAAPAQVVQFPVSGASQPLPTESGGTTLRAQKVLKC